LPNHKGAECTCTEARYWSGSGRRNPGRSLQGYLILRASRGQIIFEFRLGFELGEKQVARRYRLPCRSRSELRRQRGRQRLPGPYQQRVASSGKQLSEDVRLKFGSGRMAAGVAEISQRGSENLLSHRVEGGNA
jgi:hypothetical protein